MVNAYGLRWDAPNETSYAPTFRTVLFLEDQPCPKGLLGLATRKTT